MAKYNIPEELDALIQEYLTDGIISAKERQVLLNKAASLGLNVDEVDLYIDAQQQKADQVVDAAARKKRGQSCPYCGGSVPQLADKCPHCGQNITVEASEEIKEIIDQLEDALVELKAGKDLARSKATVERYVRKAQLYYSNNPKINTLVEQINLEIAAASNKKAMLRKFLISLKDKPNAAGGVAVGALFFVIFFISFLYNWMFRYGFNYINWSIGDGLETAFHIVFLIIYVGVFFLVRTILRNSNMNK